MVERCSAAAVNRCLFVVFSGLAIGCMAACTATHRPTMTQGSTMPVAAAVEPQDDFTLDPFKAIVRWRVRHSFAALNRQDAAPALALMDEQVTYTFDSPGARHALAGTRRGKQAVRRWFARLFGLLPGQFVVHRVDVLGWPWRANVLVHFEDRVQPLHGAAYVNRGRQEVELHWGKAVRVHTHVETEKVERALAELVRHGISEAGAPPIED